MSLESVNDVPGLYRAPYNARLSGERGRRGRPGRTAPERHRRGPCVSKGRDGRGSSVRIDLLYGFFI
jgi:hypothetical protein